MLGTVKARVAKPGPSLVRNVSTGATVHFLPLPLPLPLRPLPPFDFSRAAMPAELMHSMLRCSVEGQYSQICNRPWGHTT